MVVSYTDTQDKWVFSMVINCKLVCGIIRLLQICKQLFQVKTVRLYFISSYLFQVLGTALLPSFLTWKSQFCWQHFLKTLHSPYQNQTTLPVNLHWSPCNLGPLWSHKHSMWPGPLTSTLDNSVWSSWKKEFCFVCDRFMFVPIKRYCMMKHAHECMLYSRNFFTGTCIHLWCQAVFLCILFCIFTALTIKIKSVGMRATSNISVITYVLCKI